MLDAAPAEALPVLVPALSPPPEPPGRALVLVQQPEAERLSVEDARALADGEAAAALLSDAASTLARFDLWLSVGRALLAARRAVLAQASAAAGREVVEVRGGGLAARLWREFLHARGHRHLAALSPPARHAALTMAERSAEVLRWRAANPERAAGIGNPRAQIRAIEAQRGGITVNAAGDGVIRARDRLRAEARALRQERDGLAAEVAALTAERDALRAEVSRLRDDRDRLGAAMRAPTIARTLAALRARDDALACAAAADAAREAAEDRATRLAVLAQRAVRAARAAAARAAAAEVRAAGRSPTHRDSAAVA